MAKDLGCFLLLRRLIGEIAASKTALADLVCSPELLALMADWLPPLVKAPWSEVDGIGDRKLHRSPTLLTRAVALAAWALADRDLPRELVVNHAEKA